MKTKQPMPLAPVQKNIPLPLVALYPHARNFRNHPPDQIRMLKASLERYGQVRSIVVQDCENGIVQAADEEDAISEIERVEEAAHA